MAGELARVTRERIDGVVQAYWVTSAEVKSLLGKVTRIKDEHKALEVFAAASKRLGGNAKLADSYATKWAWSGVDGLDYRCAAAAALNSSTLLRAEIESAKREAQYHDPKENARRGRMAGAQAQRGAGTVKAMALLSQAAHPEKSLVLHRGVAYAQAEAIKAALERGDKEIVIGTGAVSSFSESSVQAAKFARGRSHVRGEAQHGVVISIRVPREAIALSHRAVPTIRGGQVVGQKEVCIFTRGAIRISAADVRVIK